MFRKPESGCNWEEREKKLNGDLGLKGLLPKFDCPGIQSGKSDPSFGLRVKDCTFSNMDCGY